MNQRPITYVAPDLHGVVRTTKLLVAMSCLAGLMILPLGAQELIKNGNFEVPTATPSTVIPFWTTFDQANGTGAFYVVSGTAAPPGTANPTVGPQSGLNYASSFQPGQGSHALLQTFTVPPFLGKVTLSYDMFVNDWNNGPFCTGLDYTVASTECGRVDLLTASAAPLSTAPGDVIRNFYQGADAPTNIAHPYIHYTFDITANVTPGGTYQIRFAEADNQLFFNLGVDNVSIMFDSGDFYQVRYASNLSVADSVVNITNSGARGADLQSGSTTAITGTICANVYAFSPDEQMVSCCSCPVTPNGLVSLSAQKDLISNTLTAGVPTSLVIKLLATVPAAGSLGCGSSAAAPGPLSEGMVAFGPTPHLNSSNASYSLAETPFAVARLSVGELERLTRLCTFINANGSGFGICKACKLGGLGAVAK